MRAALLALVSVCALAACGQSADAPSSAPEAGSAAAGGAPNMTQAAYRIEATITNPDNGDTMPMVIIRDHDKVRMEMSAGGGRTTIINNPETQLLVSISEVAGRTMALSMPQSGYTDPGAEWSALVDGGTATMTGPCAGAGQVGSTWSSTSAEGEPQSVCVTNDGIILSAAQNGRTTWETTSVERGAQSADLFALPAGVEVMELPPGALEAIPCTLR
eukprot:Opistho-1_new@107912